MVRLWFVVFVPPGALARRAVIGVAVLCCSCAGAIAAPASGGGSEVVL